MKNLLVFLCLSFVASAYADTVLTCLKTVCTADPNSRYYVTHVYPQSIDVNGTTTAYVDAEGIAGYGRGAHRTDTWYVVVFDNTGTLTSSVYSNSGYTGPNGYKAPIPEGNPAYCCQVTNGNQSAYSEYVTNPPYWQGRLVTP